MAWSWALLAAGLANAGLSASGAYGEPPGAPAAPGKTAGGKMGGVPYSKVGKGPGGIPYHNAGPGPMVKPAGNTGAPDVLGALSGKPTASMGGPMGALSSAPAMGWMGSRGPGVSMDNPTGALSSGGMNPAMLQMALGGMNAGVGMMSGQPIGQAAGNFVNQSAIPALMAKPPASSDGSGDQLAELMEMLEARRMGGTGPPRSPFGMMGGYT